MSDSNSIEVDDIPKDVPAIGTDEPKQTFAEWLHEGNRNEALQDVYFEDEIGPGCEFLNWALGVYYDRFMPIENGGKTKQWPFR